MFYAFYFKTKFRFLINCIENSAYSLYITMCISNKEYEKSITIHVNNACNELEKNCAYAQRTTNKSSTDIMGMISKNCLKSL